MNDNSVFGIMDLLIVVSGCYVLYQYYLMIKTGKLRENRLMSKEINIKKCKDQQGYIKEVAPKQLIWGLVSIGCGIVGLLQDFVMPISAYAYLGAIVVFVAVTAWYCIALRKAQKKYW